MYAKMINKPCARQAFESSFAGQQKFKGPKSDARNPTSLSTTQMPTLRSQW